MASKARKLGLKTAFSLVLILGGVFLIKTLALADISQLNGPEFDNLFSKQTPKMQTLGRGLTGTSNQIEIGYSSFEAVPGTVELRICETSSTPIFQNNNCSNPTWLTSTFVGNEVFGYYPTSTALRIATIDFATTTFDPTKYYGLYLYGQGSNLILAGAPTSTDFFINGHAISASNNNSPCSPNNIGDDCVNPQLSDWYFNLSNANAPLSARLEIRKPLNRFLKLDNSTTTDAFSWFVNVTSTDLTQLSTTTLTVFYDRLSTSTFNSSDTINFSTDRGELQFIPKSDDLIFPPLVEPTTWYALAQLKSGGSIIGQSPLTTFGVYFGSGYTYNTSTTINDLNASCSADSNIFASSICRWLLSLFYPSNDALKQFADFGDTIKSKPPLGYYFAVQNAISSSLTMGTSTNAILSASTTSAMSPIFTPIRSVLVWGLWIIGGLFVFNKIRHLNF